MDFDWLVLGDPVLDSILGLTRADRAGVFFGGSSRPDRDAVYVAIGRTDLPINWYADEPPIRFNFQRYAIAPTGQIYDRHHLATVPMPDSVNAEMEEFELSAEEVVEGCRVLVKYPEIDVSASLRRRLRADLAHITELSTESEDLATILIAVEDWG
jgi:hypothetical protein